MQWVQSIFGLQDTSVGSAPPPRANARHVQDFERRREQGGATNQERLESAIRTNEMRADMLEDEIEELKEELQEKLAVQNRTGARSVLQKIKQKENQLKIQRGKLLNLQTQLDTLGQAHGNLEQAYLTREGADELGALTGHMAQLDVEGAMEDLREGHDEVQDTSQLLAEPLFQDGEWNPDTNETIDEELDRMMNRAGDEQKVSLINAMPKPPTRAEQDVGVRQRVKK